MIKLYCYNSPATSSVGFQEGLWMVQDGVCTMMDEKEASPQLRGLLLDGGAKALCMDTARSTRAFMLRGIFVRQGAQSGWRMNIILETDQGSYAQWLDLVAAFLLDHTNIVEQFAGLFAVKYDGGEHYVLNTEGFEQLLCKVNGASSPFRAETETCTSSQAALCALVEKLCASFDAHEGRLLLLVPTATVDYFMKHTSLKKITAPEVCIGSEQWETALFHKVPESKLDTEGMQPEPQWRESKGEEDTLLSGTAVLAIGAVGAVLLGYSVFRTVRRSRRRRKGR